MMAIQQDYLITTVDNPYNPWTDWDLWYAYDENSGYHTCSYLARLMSVGEGLSDQEEDQEYNDAVDEIIRYDVTNKYAKIAKNDPVPMVKQ